MIYRIDRFRHGWEEIAIKHNIYDVLKVIARDLDPEFDIHYVVIENDGKSDFPIMSINTLQQYYDYVEQYLGKKEDVHKLTKSKRRGKIDEK